MAQYSKTSLWFWIVNKELLAFIQKNSDFTMYHIVNLEAAENGTENWGMFVDYIVNQWELFIKYKDFLGYLWIIEELRVKLKKLSN